MLGVVAVAVMMVLVMMMVVVVLGVVAVAVMWWRRVNCCRCACSVYVCVHVCEGVIIRDGGGFEDDMARMLSVGIGCGVVGRVYCDNHGYSPGGRD